METITAPKSAFLKEFGGIQIHFEHKTQNTIASDDLAALKNFLDVERDQISQYKQLPLFKPDIYSQRLYALGNHATAVRELRENLTSADIAGEDIQLILAKNPYENIVGFSYVSIDKQIPDAKDQITFTYLGVGWEYTNKGIGTELLLQRFDDLRHVGIPSYKTRVWKATLDLNTKLGLQIEHYDPKDYKKIRVTFE